MSIQLQIQETPNYMEARFIGEGSTEEIWRRFELIAESCKRANKNKLLLDLTGASTNGHLTDKYHLGDKAEIFMHYKLIKVAVVVRPEKLDPFRFGETVARNRWVNAQVFTNSEDAEEWLKPVARAAGLH
jgi:hypothetical protein